jgi:hypothetical protein
MPLFLGVSVWGLIASPSMLTDMRISMYAHVVVVTLRSCPLTATRHWAVFFALSANWGARVITGLAALGAVSIGILLMLLLQHQIRAARDARIIEALEIAENTWNQRTVESAINQDVFPAEDSDTLMFSRKIRSNREIPLAREQASKIDPSVTAFMQVVISVAVLSSALYVLLLAHEVQPAMRDWACGMIGTIVGFWLGT